MPTTQVETSSSARRGADEAPTRTSPQRVVVVNGCTTILDLLEKVLDAGRYDLVFIESCEHAYSQIRRLQPHLVVLCTRIDDSDSFQLLSMLKLDGETRQIPVVTYTTEDQGPEESAREDAAELPDAPVFSRRPTTRMH